MVLMPWLVVGGSKLVMVEGLVALHKGGIVNGICLLEMRALSSEACSERGVKIYALHYMLYYPVFLRRETLRIYPVCIHTGYSMACFF